MSFNVQGLDPNGSGSRGGIKVGTYKTTDTWAVVEGDGYFDSFASTFTTGDMLWVKASEGNRLYKLTVTAGDVAITAIFTEGAAGTVTSASNMPFTGVYDLASTGAQELTLADPVVGSIVTLAKPTTSTAAIAVTVSASTAIHLLGGNRVLTFDVEKDTALLICVAALEIAVIVGATAPAES